MHVDRIKPYFTEKRSKQKVNVSADQGGDEGQDSQSETDTEYEDDDQYLVSRRHEGPSTSTKEPQIEENASDDETRSFTPPTPASPLVPQEAPTHTVRSPEKSPGTLARLKQFAFGKRSLRSEGKSTEVPQSAAKLLERKTPVHTGYTREEWRRRKTQAPPPPLTSVQEEPSQPAINEDQ